MNDASRIIPIVPAAQQLAAADYRALDVERDYPGALFDGLHRPLRDLRISMTDRCNLRCIYCMPREIFDESHTHLARSEVLSFEEIERLARLFIRLGVRKIRLTGGEPLLRRGIERLIEKLARLQTAEGHAAGDRADHQRRPVGAQGAGAERRGIEPRDSQPRRLDR